MDFFFALSPVLLITILILFFRSGVIITGVAGFLYTAAIVTLYFKTPLIVVFLSSLDGVLTTFPVILVVYAGILLADILISTGALKKVGDVITGNVRSKSGKALLLSFGLGNVLEGLGIVAEPLSAPLFYAENFLPEEAAALSILGYSGLLTLEFAGIIMTVLSLATGISLSSLIVPVTICSIIAVLLLFMLLPYIVVSHRWDAHDLKMVTVAAFALSLSLLISSLYISYALSGVIGGITLMGTVKILGRRSSGENSTSVKEPYKVSLRALVPYLSIAAIYLICNLFPPVKKFLLSHLSIDVTVAGTHTIRVKPFLDIYTYLFLAGFVAILLDGGGVKGFFEVVSHNLPKGSRAALAMALFGAMGQVISFSGYDPTFSIIAKEGNLARVLAEGLFALTGNAYLFFVPLLGWAGTFLTGYGIASIMLFGKLQVSIGKIIGIDPSLIAAMLAVGAGVGSISSPFKVAIATPLCNAVGREPAILRKTIPAGVFVSFVLGIMLYLYARM